VPAVIEIGLTLGQIILLLITLVVQLVQLVGTHALVVVWIAWWLWGVNWSKAWPVLAQGAWAPVVLLSLIAALVWSQLDRIPPDLLKDVPNFWWQLGCIWILLAVALFCGWLQGYFGWTPPEISLEPPAPSGDHQHGHHH
jgi:hypothetical protein